MFLKSRKIAIVNPALINDDILDLLPPVQDTKPQNIPIHQAPKISS